MKLTTSSVKRCFMILRKVGLETRTRSRESLNEASSRWQKLASEAQKVKGLYLGGGGITGIGLYPGGW